MRGKGERVLKVNAFERGFAYKQMFLESHVAIRENAFKRVHPYKRVRLENAFAGLQVHEGIDR